MAAYARDVAKMTLVEFQWCLDKNHWNAELEHMPYGHPDPPLQEPVWWWPGWGAVYGAVPGGINTDKYVERWFIRGKERAREDFTPFFGTYESDALEEFAKKNVGTGSFADAVRREVSKHTDLEAAARSVASLASAELSVVAPAGVTPDKFLLSSPSTVSHESRNRVK